jgi:AraC-like DNA-binding protein
VQQYTHYPSAALRPYLEFYRFIQFENDKEFTAVLRDYPKTAMDMVFCFDGHVQIKLHDGKVLTLDSHTFIGHFDQAYEVLMRGSLTLFHIRFKANGVYPLSSLALRKVVNGCVPLADFMGEMKQYHLYERLALAATMKEKVQVMENFLTPYYQGEQLHHRLDYGLRLIEQSKGLIAVKQLAEGLNTNYKSLDRWFNKKVGLNPKRFLQITRFKHILLELEKHNQPDWIQLVVDFGFYDQAHFIKEFKQFAGAVPTLFIDK